MNRGFWRARNVFVTGHTGFKGAWLSLWLEQLGARTTGYALEPSTAESLFNLVHAQRWLTDVRGDVRNLAAVEAALSRAQPEIVFHLAAQSLVRTSYDRPVETFSSNVMGCVHILDAIRRTPSVGAVVIVTSDKCYQNQFERPHREDDALGGDDPYSASKACAELVTAAYLRSYFRSNITGLVGVASARAGNVIGGGDQALDRLLPDLLKAFTEGRVARIRNPSATRPWQHVLDPLHGYLLLAEHLYAERHNANESWNFGPDPSDVRSVAWVADAAAAQWGNGAAWTHDSAPHPHEAMSLTLDSSRARDQLGWQPVLSVDEAISWTVRWRKGLLGGENARALSLNDIHRYEQALAKQS